MGKSSSPTPTDPYAIASAQTQVNKNAAITNSELSHVNEVNPYGSVTWEQTGTTPIPQNNNGTATTATPYVTPTVKPVISDGNRISSQAFSVMGGTGGNNPTNAAKAAYSSHNDNAANATNAANAAYDQFQNSAASQIGGTPIYTKTTKFSEPLQQQFDANNANTLSNLNSQGTLYDQIKGQTPLSADSAGAINYGLSQDQLNNYANNLKTTAGDAQGYNASTYNPTMAGNAQQANYGQIQNNLGISQGDLNNDLAATRDAYFNQQKAYLDPQWDQQQKALQTQLANAGVVQNSDAYNQALNNFSQQRNTAYNNAQNNAILNGGAEQSRLQQMALNSGNFNNSAQQQGFNQSAYNSGQQNQFNLADANSANQANQFNASAQNAAGQFNTNNGNNMQQFNANLNNEAQQNIANLNLANGVQNNSAQNQSMNQLFALKNQPFTELSALKSGTSIQQPTFGNSSTPQISPADLAGAINNQYQGQLAGYNNRQQANSQNMSTLGSLAMMYALA